MMATFHKNCTMPSRKVAMELSQSDYNMEVEKTIFNFLFPNKKEITRVHKYTLISSALTTCDISYLKELFPEMYVLQIVRNGIEVISSRMKYEGFKENSFMDHVNKWSDGVDISKECQRIFNNQYKMVRHENFLCSESLEIELDKIFKWLSLENQ